MSAKVSEQTRRQSGWAGAAGVAVALGLTELFAGMSASVPSAISAIGAVVVDVVPSWLEDLAISVFGTADKAVLAIGIVIVALVIGWFAGFASTTNPVAIVTVFLLAGIAGIAAQLAEPMSEPGPVIASTLVSVGAGIGVWYGIVSLSRPRDPERAGDVVDMSRRRFMVGVAGAVTVSAISIGVGRAMIRSRADAQRAALLLPEPIERQADPTAVNDFGLASLSPIVVGNDAFYRIDTALVVPAVDPDEWRLRITGLVDREVELSYADLSAMPLIERYVTLACVSNEVGDRLVGNALWTGVPLRDVLDMAGVRPGADQIVGRSVDGWTAGFPTELAYDGRDALVAIGMNREVLPARHGFPARLVVPGLYGYVSATKWLGEIELTTWDAFDAYWVPRGWSKEAPIKTQSRIDRPRRRQEVPSGRYALAGVAWAPTLGVTAVEVQVDGGDWRQADLSEPLSEDSWVQWRLEADLAPGDHVVRVRATDGTGFTQGERPVPPRPDGAEGWHTVAFSAV